MLIAKIFLLVATLVVILLSIYELVFVYDKYKNTRKFVAYLIIGASFAVLDIFWLLN